MSQPVAPSSSSTGFFQVLPTVEPQLTIPEAGAADAKQIQAASDDPVLARILQLYLPPQARSTVGASVHKLTRRTLHPTTLRYAVEAETDVPTLRLLNTFGEENRNDPLRTCHGWKALKDIGVEEGVISRGYDAAVTQHNRRIDQFAHSHVWSHTSTMTMCPMAMTDGAATLLRKYMAVPEASNQAGSQAVFAESYRRLTSNDPRQAWSSGQWMTERTGGSDVSGTETVARLLTAEEIQADKAAGRDQDAIGLPLGPWRIDGFKWFSSATDSDMVMMLAKTAKGGLSAFYIPMRRKLGSRTVATGSAVGEDNPTELNGIRIQRLKNKMGTRGLPTAELEIRGARGWLVGEEGRGVREIAPLFNITRIFTATGCASAWARGMSVCRAYSKVRKTRGHLLAENIQHLYWMAKETVDYWAGTHLAFLGCALQGCVEQGPAVLENTVAQRFLPADPRARECLLRLLLPVAKSQVSLGAVASLRSAMECLGGVGYCENHEDGGVLNLAKLFRDTTVNTIWEGTVSVMAEDVRRVLRDKRIAGGNVVEAVFGVWVQDVLAQCRAQFPEECAVVAERLQALIALVHGSKDPLELEYHGRKLLAHLETITCSTILLFDAVSDGDAVAGHVARRYVRSHALPGNKIEERSADWKREVEIDSLIFLGETYVNAQVPKGKL